MNNSRNTDLLDDSQVSEISLKSLFKEHHAGWKDIRDERLEPFYPKPKTRNDGVTKTQSGRYLHTKFNKFVENEPQAYYQYKRNKQTTVKKNQFKHIEKQVDLEGELAEMDRKDRIFERRFKETQKYGKKQQKHNMEQRRKRKLQNQQEMEQKEIQAQKLRDERLK